MRDLKAFYEKWASSEQGDQSKWKSPDSNHFYRLKRQLKLVLPYINEKTEVLDVGCGEGIFLSILPYCQKQGLDISSRYVEIARASNPDSSIGLFNVDEGIPYRNNSFDLVTCTEVIEHVHHPRYLLSEIKRVMKDNGRALITSYNHFNLLNIATGKAFTNKFCSADHLREYNYSELKRQIEQEGFKVLKGETYYMGRRARKLGIERVFDLLKLNIYSNFVVKKQ